MAADGYDKYKAKKTKNRTTHFHLPLEKWYNIIVRHRQFWIKEILEVV
jgi:hypothetical protein